VIDRTTHAWRLITWLFFFFLFTLWCGCVGMCCVDLFCKIEFYFCNIHILLKKSGCVVFLGCSAPSCDISRDSCVSLEWPRRTAHLHRSAGEPRLLAARIWSSHLLLARPGGLRLQVWIETELNSSSRTLLWTAAMEHMCRELTEHTSDLVYTQPINAKYSLDADAHDQWSRRVTGSTCSGQFRSVHVLWTSL